MRVWAVLTVVAGVALVAAAVANVTIGEVLALDEAQRAAFDGAVIRYELARTDADVRAIFGAPDDPARPLKVAAMDALNRLDLRAFVPAYVGFLVCAAFFAGGFGRMRAAWVAAGLALGAGGLDVVETVNMLAASPEHTPGEAHMTRVFWLATGKFVLLVLNALAMAWVVMAERGLGRWVLAGLLCLPVFGVGAMYADGDFIPLSALSFTVGWIGLMVSAVASLIGRRSAAQRT